MWERLRRATLRPRCQARCETHGQLIQGVANKLPHDAAVQLITSKLLSVSQVGKRLVPRPRSRSRRAQSRARLRSPFCPSAGPRAYYVEVSSNQKAWTANRRCNAPPAQHHGLDTGTDVLLPVPRAREEHPKGLLPGGALHRQVTVRPAPSNLPTKIPRTLRQVPPVPGDPFEACKISRMAPPKKRPHRARYEGGLPKRRARSPSEQAARPTGSA